MFKNDQVGAYNPFSKYCETEFLEKLISLSEAEITQLNLYQPKVDGVSPEVRNDASPASSLHFEVKRALSRVYGFLLLLSDDKEAYAHFVQGQSAALSQEAFEKLTQETKNLNEDQKAIIRTTCFLTISQQSIAALKLKGIEPSKDSEVFLTQVAALAETSPDIMPAIDALSISQRASLIKAYWYETHFRHLLFLEGGENMVRELRKGIKSGEFTREDFKLWVWRWRTNLFGFKGGNSPVNYDAITHQFSELLIEELNKLFDSPEMDFMTSYLGKLQKVLNLNQYSDLSETEKAYIARLVISLHDKKDLATPEGARDIIKLYRQFKENAPQEAEQLIESFEKFIKNADIKTPTYVPAILNGALNLFTKDEKLKALLPGGFTPLQAAILFNFHYSSVIYQRAILDDLPRISAMIFAKEDSLKKNLLTWLNTGMNAQFNFSDELDLQMQPPQYGVVISLGEIASTNMNLTFAAFQQLLQDKCQISRETFEEKWPSLFQTRLSPLIGKIRLGKWIADYSVDISALPQAQKAAIIDIRFGSEFCRLVSEAFNVNFALTREEFNSAWCAMCPVTEQNFNDLKSLRQDSEIADYYYSNTNHLQYSFIEDQLKSYEPGFSLPEDRLLLSFHVGLEKDALVEELNKTKIDQRQKLSAIIYIIGDSKQVENPISQAVAAERQKQIACYVDQQNGAFYFTRNKKDHPSSYAFIKACIEQVKEELLKRSQKKMTMR
jgi:hypothetical protein